MSDCKRFRICKSKSASPEQKALGEWVYVAFDRGVVLVAGSLDACKAACDANH